MVGWIKENEIAIERIERKRVNQRIAKARATDGKNKTENRNSRIVLNQYRTGIGVKDTNKYIKWK